jgi:hypothetical protein
MRRILIILLIILLVGTGVWYFYVKPRQASGVSPVPNILKPFFPVSTTTSGSFGTVPGTIGGVGTSNSTSPSAAVPAFKQLTAFPVAGYSVFTTSSQVSIPSADPKAKPTVQTVTDNYLDYVSRNNGYVYEIKNNAIALQVTNIFIPNIYEAYFADNNTTAILRFLRSDDRTIASYSTPIPSANNDGSRTQEAGTYLPDNIFDMAISPDQTQVADITTDKTGAILSTSTSVGTKIKTLIRSPFTEWIPLWAGNTLYLQTKAASIADGFLYSVDSTDARLERIVGNIPGLTASVSPSGTYVLYSASTLNGFTTSLLDTKTNATTQINLSILPEKCAWMADENLICAGNNTVPSAVYPDAWYAGTIHFSDQLYEINTVSNTYTVLYDGQGQSFDMTNLQLNENQQMLYFIDKSSGLLWQFNY